MTDSEIMLAAGGRQLMLGDEEVWWFGYIPADDRASELVEWIFDDEASDLSSVEAKATEFNDTLPDFKLDGTLADSEKAFLWETWKHPKVIEATDGSLYTGVHQITGSCVGAGGGNAVFTLAAVEVARLGDMEAALVPFWLLPYGRSRMHSGINGRGDGSTGFGFAKAITNDGVIPANLDRLPKYSRSDGLIWGREAELAWSDGRRIEQSWLDKAKVHLVKSAARIRSADEGRDAIRAGYPVGWCGMWGGLMQCEVKGTPQVLMNRRRGQWAHQQSCHGWWDHPTLGEIFYILNQWGMDAHGRDPAGGPAGGYWISKQDFEWQCRNGECYVFSQFDGFPAPDYEIPWVF